MGLIGTSFDMFRVWQLVIFSFDFSPFSTDGNPPDHHRAHPTNMTCRLTIWFFRYDSRMERSSSKGGRFTRLVEPTPRGAILK